MRTFGPFGLSYNRLFFSENVYTEDEQSRLETRTYGGLGSNCSTPTYTDYLVMLNVALPRKNAVKLLVALQPGAEPIRKENVPGKFKLRKFRVLLLV